MGATMLAEFESPEQLLAAVRSLRASGHAGLDAFTPYPVHGLEQALGFSRSPLTWIVLPFALSGASLAYVIQWATAAIDYPLVAGGRPAHAPPAFVPITFEMGVLSTALAGVVALLWLCRLPRLHHPVFEVEGFERASIDRFWLSIPEREPGDGEAPLDDELRRLGATRVVRTVDVR